MCCMLCRHCVTMKELLRSFLAAPLAQLGSESQPTPTHIVCMPDCKQNSSIDAHNVLTLLAEGGRCNQYPCCMQNLARSSWQAWSWI